MGRKGQKVKVLGWNDSIFPSQRTHNPSWLWWSL